jgi:hypothetical protein
MAVQQVRVIKLGMCKAVVLGDGGIFPGIEVRGEDDTEIHCGLLCCGRYLLRSAK